MTFLIENFRSGRGYFYTDTPKGGAATHTYINTSDTLDTILSSGYFPAFYGQSSEEIKDYDYLWLTGSDSSILVKMKSTATSPQLNVAISQAELTGAFNLTFQGPWSSNITVSCPYELQSDSANIFMPQVIGSSTTGNSLISSITGSVVPLNLRPSATYTGNIAVANPGVVEGYIFIDATTGAVQSAPLSAYGVTIASYGFYATPISYITSSALI